MIGIVSVEKTKSDIILQSDEKVKQAQMMSFVKRQPKQIDELALHLIYKINLEEMSDITLYGCTIAPNGNMILKLVKTIDCTTLLYSVACISDEHVAITKEQSVDVINIKMETVEKRYELSSCPDGIICFEKILMWSQQRKGIKRADLEKGDIKTLKSENKMKVWTFLTTNRKYIYYANYSNSTVTCSNMNGNEIWSKKISKIKLSYGITIDNDSNIYIASYGTNSIVVLSPDGKFNRRLLCSEDGINLPRGIFFDKRRNHLLVANEKGTVFLYEVS
ncbi:unnamed protein product [Mytilus coruscus]|uniref:Uncharacterized protein n=1 Tax=Mytilus coruscus TaxID=42192 RepID=A0A6J8F3S2_MYTCO|nr:unnamed protein product [Mytilus coruscus]